MKHRRVIFPTHGDPVLVNLWAAAAHTMIDDEVDDLSFAITGPVVDVTYDVLLQEFGAIISAGNEVVHEPGEGSARHGEMMSRLIETAPDDCNLVLLESDCFLLEEHVLHKNFELLDSGAADVVGSGRDTASQWLAQTAIKELLPAPPTDEHFGVGLWPCMLFASKETLLEAGPNYGPMGWQAGDWITGIPGPAPMDVAADTFYEAALKMRADGKRIHAIPQNKYHATIEGSLGRDTRRWETTPTIHIGSLSAVARPDGTFAITEPVTDTNKHELAKRLATLLLGVRYWISMSRWRRHHFNLRDYVESLRASTDLPERLIKLHMIRIGSALVRTVPALESWLVEDKGNFHKAGLWDDILEYL